MYKTLHKKQGSVTVQLRFARSSVTFCAPRDSFIRDCDSKDIVYALKTASEDMKNVFFANMSKRMAETVKGDLEITTNVRLKEVEEAQQRIVNLIRKLEDAGEVIINKGGDDDNIVV